MHSLAHHVPAVLANDAVSPVAPEALVHLTLGALKAPRAHTFHSAIPRNRARLRIHAVVVANIWNQHETSSLKDIKENYRNK